MAAFTKEEYEQRIERTKAAMNERGIDLLFISQPANMNYLTGYDGWSFYVHQCVLVSLDQKEPMWLGRGMDANGARITTYLPDDCIRQYADDYVQSTVKHPMHFIADVIKEKGWDKKRIGVEMDQFYFTHRNYVELEKSLPDATFVDANTLVNWVRIIKSEAELEFMRAAGKVAIKVMDAAVANINVGSRECDAAAAIAAAQYSGTEEYAGDYPAIVPLMMAGEATKTPHLTWSGKRYTADEAVLLELSGVYKHYHAPIARTIFLGKNPPKLMQDTARTVIDGLKATLDFIKPGVTGEEVEAEWRRAISHSTVVKEARLGYSIGLNYPPDWGEQTISLRPGDKTVVKPNMALHLIPGIWYDDVGFEVDASIRITETGYESLYEYPVEIFLK
ncbi:M24 family metallopeptidase [Sediminispirochaeta smaragdinae]|uniref:Creatinase n=1 Tax=Sediminispirochaeta smaragdinae (strain DSM 11293 / JCM 15392 / SEBR 4228) TaxID=573413 RepID=E1RBI5_SEDSS|nr:M24 family metallopeptidase [Sediminispirochaeta smaragdinae]ADK79715.1 creatinase [Sediminispirochaeta smaragdinae DSM 11293]